MADGIHRIVKQNNFVIMDKRFFENENLSWKAKGILGYLLTLPDDWKFYLDEIVTHSKDKRDSFRSGWKELQDNGYVKRVDIRNERGVITGWETHVYEYPDTDFPHVDKPLMDNPTLLSTKDTKNKITKEKEYVFLEKDDHPFIAIYLKHFEKRFKRKHKKVTVEAYHEIMRCIEEAEEVDDDTFEEGVIEHFDELPKSNDGSMLPFTRTFMRRYTVQTYI